MQPIAGLVLSRAQAVDSRAVSDGAVLVNMSSGACFELNRIGAEVWGLLAQPTTEEAIREALSGRYPVEPTALASDVRRLLEDLARHHLITAETSE